MTTREISAMQQPTADSCSAKVESALARSLRFALRLAGSRTGIIAGCHQTAEDDRGPTVFASFPATQDVQGDALLALMPSSKSRINLDGLSERKFPARLTLIPLTLEGAMGFLALESTVIASMGDEKLELVAQFAACALDRELMAHLAEEEAAGRQRAKNRLRMTYNSMLKHQRYGRMGDWRFDMQTRLTTGSVECGRLFGYPPDIESVDYDTWLKKVHPDDRARVERVIWTAMANDLPIEIEYRIFVHGEVRYMLQRGMPEHEDDGRRFYAGVHTDVTEQRLAEQRLRSMQADLASSTRLAALGELAGSIAHELNQPLTSILAGAQASRRWLRQRPVDCDEAQLALDRVVEQSRRAAAVLAGLRRLAADAAVPLIAVDINATVRDVVSFFHGDVAAAGVALSLRLSPQRPRVLGDAVQIQQVLDNLLRNALVALRESTEGGRTLTVLTTESAGMVEVIVEDNGPGIAPQVAPRLFEPLKTTRSGHFGLGLSICRRIVKAHGGTIAHSSVRPHGARFRFTLPLIPTQYAGSPNCQSPPVPGD